MTVREAGPFYHQYSTSMKYFNDLKLIDVHATDYATIELLATGDLIEFQRQYDPRCLVVQKSLKKMGKCTIFHVDDNIWEIPPGNPAGPVYAPGTATRQNYERLLSACDWVTTSTPYLSQLAKRFNPNVTIMRNLVEVDFIRSFMHPGRDNPNEVRIGWTGTPHHHDDIQIVEPVFKEILAKYPQVKLVFMGFAPVDKGVLHANMGRWEYYEFVQVDAFYPALASMDFDIGIAPLTNHPFNKAKTARKAQEYAAMGLPMVLSPMGAYDEWIHKDTCLKPKNNSFGEWMHHLSWLIEHKAEREQMGERALAQVRKENDIKKWIYERQDQYEEILKIFKKGIKNANTNDQPDSVQSQDDRESSIG